MSDAVQTLLDHGPYDLSESEKMPLFMNAMRESLSHHLAQNDGFRMFCDAQGFDVNGFTSIYDIPYIPVSLFKNQRMVSVPDTMIKTILQSSATSGVPSSVVLDQETSRRQGIVSGKVMASYLGNYRRPYFILDEDPRTQAPGTRNARTAATLGFMILSNQSHYFMTTDGSDLRLDLEKFETQINDIANSGQEVLIFGFTFVLYHHVIRELKRMNRRFQLPPTTRIAHIGGWKKLESQSVDKSTFLSDINQVLGVAEDRIYDVYGFTEQMGLIYASIGSLPKKTSTYSEIIIRDLQTLAPVPDGQEGFIQIVTPIPHSYPGNSILTEDVGRIVGRGQDATGRWGTAFEVIGRAKGTEVRGCGDIMSEYVR